MTYKLCVIGSEAFLFPFLQFGITTYTPTDAASLRAFLQDASQEGFGIIYIEDHLCHDIQDILAELREDSFPIIIPIGGPQEEESYAEQVMKLMMEKAVGINLL